jgi:hypothetical protein
MLIQLAISRRREALADASGVLLTRYPEGLISALQKIQVDDTPMRTAKDSTAHMWLDTPFKGKGASWWHKLFIDPSADRRAHRGAAEDGGIARAIDRSCWKIYLRIERAFSDRKFGLRYGFCYKINPHSLSSFETNRRRFN